jgi:hypothetical protein
LQATDNAIAHLNFTLGTRQLGPIKPELLTSLLDRPRVQGLAGTSEGNLRRSLITMNRYHDVPFVPLLVLMPVETASLLFQPFSERRAFHGLAP